MAFGAGHARVRGVQVSGEFLGGVIEGEFGAVLLAVAVIERREDDGRAELALVDQVRGQLVVAVDADREMRADLLLSADVEIVGPLSIGSGVGRHRRRGRRGDQRIARRRHELGHRF